MSYCINPNCTHRQNPDTLEICQSCGTKLLINERYQITRPLRAGLAYNSEVFEVKDLDEGGTLKVLKSLSIKHVDSKFAELFEKEAQVLIWLSSKWLNHQGIPKVKPDGYFIFGMNNGLRRLQCLVMEKIEGENLEEWVEQNQPISQEQALNWLQQLVEILDKVHKQGLWHRDIKPSNIMLKPNGQLVLIDFGAVGVGETRIVSADYTPPEQIEGRTVLQSDFFALGRTFVYLLTGRHPHDFSKNSLTGQFVWRNLVSAISNDFAQLIDDLMAPSSAARPQNTQDILQRIQAIDNTVTSEPIIYQITPLININQYDITSDQSPSNQPNSSRISIPSREYEITRSQLPNRRIIQNYRVKALWLSGATLLLGLTGTILYNVLPCQVLGSLKSCLAISGDKLSLGEEILSSEPATPEKQKGVKAFREGQYDQAINWLDSARNNYKSDPETLIYLNNAKLKAEKAKAYTIAVAVPLNRSSMSSDGLASGLEILRGVAQAQDEFNQKQDGVGIKVLIADDANDSNQAQQIAKTLVSYKDVLAVVGHFTSDSTLAASDIYQRNRLVFISPTSTSEDLSDKSQSYKQNYFFRTVPSDRVTAQRLANYLLKQGERKQAAIFYNPKSRYSNSLENQFSTSFTQKGGKIVERFDLSPLMTEPKRVIDNAKKQGANVLVLFPNSQDSILSNTRKLISANQCSNFIVGGDTVYTPEILDVVGRETTKCLVLAVPWYRVQSPDRKFPQAAETLWGAVPSWRTAFAYDATRALIAALENTSKPSRIQLQQTLSNPDFKTMGATGKINFEPDGDRKEGQIQLVPNPTR